MLARPGLRDDSAFAHPPGQQRLSHGVVDLVSPRVVQVFPLEHHAGANALAEAGSLGQWRRTADEFLQKTLKLGPEGGITAGRLVYCRQLIQSCYQRLWHIAATVWAK